ncbi:hypothetical protein [Alicyclobacillus sp. SO9]|nr:hypothetical protein [Alicyclobacillus sp. SO9]QQE77147.1 hypothetical protein GI364_14330 [Alicyclobacillus sp. SO9]
MKKETGNLNPIQSFVQVWRAFEKIAVVLSAALVVGTVGYVSLHALT